MQESSNWPNVTQLPIKKTLQISQIRTSVNECPIIDKYDIVTSTTYAVVSISYSNASGLS